MLAQPRLLKWITTAVTVVQFSCLCGPGSGRYVRVNNINGSSGRYVRVNIIRDQHKCLLKHHNDPDAVMSVKNMMFYLSYITFTQVLHFSACPRWRTHSGSTFYISCQECLPVFFPRWTRWVWWSWGGGGAGRRGGGGGGSAMRYMLGECIYWGCKWTVFYIILSTLLFFIVFQTIVGRHSTTEMALTCWGSWSTAWPASSGEERVEINSNNMVLMFVINCHFSGCVKLCDVLS